MTVFRDREEAGEKLAEKLHEGEIVLAIPRGGVVVGKVVAEKLGLPLQVVVIKKVGAPGQEELAIGAMGPDQKVVWNEQLRNSLGLTETQLAPQVKSAKLKIKSYNLKFPSYQGDLTNKTVILVDDGVATGATAEAAVKWLKGAGVERVIVAIPVGAREAVEMLRGLADTVVCLWIPELFEAVGQFYENFPQVTDEEVIDILNS